MSSESQNGRIWEALIKIGTALAWVCAGAIISHEVRLTSLESNQYTPSDHLEYERAVNERLESLDRELLTRLGKLDTKIEVIVALLKDREERSE